VIEGAYVRGVETEIQIPLDIELLLPIIYHYQNQPLIMDPRPGSVPVRAAAPTPVVARATERAERYLGTAKAANTIRAYNADWQHFTAWCDDAHRSALPASSETVALYVSDLAATAKVSTIRRRLTTISQAHERAGYPTPTRHPLVRDVLDGIKRELGVLQRGKTPLLLGDVQAMVEDCDDAITGIRDRALLLLGFAGCFRRSEVAGLRVEDLTFVAEGVVVFLHRSKTDQMGEGVKKGIPYGDHAATCPVRAIQAWLDVLGVARGPVFRPITKSGKIGTKALTDRSVALIVKRHALAAGLDPRKYAGHSLRSGFATAAAIAGASERAIIQQGAWASEKMARRYIRDANLFRDNAAGQVGL
jgi:site-specific recombinase XerD